MLDGERLGCEVLQVVRRETVNSIVVRTFRSAVSGRPEGLHYAKNTSSPQGTRRTHEFRILNSEFRIALILCVLGVLRGGAFVVAQVEMPDPKQMSGIPRPDGQMTPGTVTVRLIRGDLSNNITGHPVELHVGDKVQTVKTDDAGRAEFNGLTPGTSVTAVAVVDGGRARMPGGSLPKPNAVRARLGALGQY